MKNKTIPYLIARFFDGVSSGMFMMALPWIMLSEEDMGLFVAITALVCTTISFTLTPFFATWVDRHARKTILILMQVVQASTALMVFLVYWHGMGSHWILAFAQLLFWLSNDLAWCCNNAFTQENYQKSEYAKLSSYQEVVMQGTTLGVGAFAIILLEYWSMTEFALLAASASFISCLFYIMTPYTRQFIPTLQESFFTQLTATKDIFNKKRQLYTFLALSCLSYPVLTFLVKLVPIYFAEQGISGSWFAAWEVSYGLGALLSGVLVAKLLTRYQHEKAMIVSIFIIAMVLIVMGIYLSPTLIILLTIILGFFNSYNRIARTNKLHHEIAMDERGRVDGGLKLFSTLMQSLSYILIALLSHFRITEMGFVIVGVILLFASIKMLKLNKISSLQLI